MRPLKTSTTCALPGLYHGTPVAFDAFRDPLVTHPDRGAGYDHQGKAIYLTTDPNGYGRFFARESCAKLAFKLIMAGHHDESDRVSISDGVVMSVELLPGTTILDLNDAPERIKDLFTNSVGDKKIGAKLRQAVLDAGYDGLVFQELNFPEGWEVARAKTVALNSGAVQARQSHHHRQQGRRGLPAASGLDRTRRKWAGRLRQPQRRTGTGLGRQSCALNQLCLQGQEESTSKERQCLKLHNPRSALLKVTWLTKPTMAMKSPWSAHSTAESPPDHFRNAQRRLCGGDVFAC